MQKCNFFTDLQIPDSCHQKLSYISKEVKWKPGQWHPYCIEWLKYLSTCYRVEVKAKRSKVLLNKETERTFSHTSPQPFDALPKIQRLPHFTLKSKSRYIINSSLHTEQWKPKGTICLFFSIALRTFSLQSLIQFTSSQSRLHIFHSVWYILHLL